MAKFTLKEKKEHMDFIRSHHGAMTQQEMVKQMGVAKMTVTRLVNELGLKKRNYVRKPILRSSGSTYFNVHVHQDWLVCKN